MQQYDICSNLKIEFRSCGIEIEKQKQNTKKHHFSSPSKSSPLMS